jgi:O-acetyl-ADP-ribose deacetylase (regulator of RNase III)
VPSCDAQTFVTEFFNCIVSRHGCPYGLILRTDNRSAFISQVTKTFCESLAVTQVFSTPYHHTSIAKAEQSFATVNNALKILCENQRDWSQHLQAVAMALRRTATISSSLSPFEIIFGRKMPLACDIALMNEPPLIPSADFYASDIKPKLEILHEIAMQCSAENAARHCDSHNENAVTPTFKTGDKVLLSNEAVKPGQSKKLSRRFSGPHFIIKSLDNFTYYLKHVLTGKLLRRPVHASRLIEYRELTNDFRLQQARSKPCLFTGLTIHRRIRIEVVVADLVLIQTHATVNQTDELLTHPTGLSRKLATAAGAEIRDECASFIAENGCLPQAQPYCTTAGALSPPVKTIIHIVGLNAADFVSDQLTLVNKLKYSYYACLIAANAKNEIESIALSIFDTGRLGIDAWTSAHAALRAVSEFDINTLTQSGSLRLIKFVTLDIADADVITAVNRQMLSDTDHSTLSASDNEHSRQTAQNKTTRNTTPQPAKSDEWRTINRILRHRKRKGLDEYLVQWSNGDAPSWIKRNDITDFALQKYYAHRQRHCRRHRKQH